MYLDIALQIAIKFNELAPETKIMIFQICYIIAGIGAIFYIRHITKAEAK